MARSRRARMARTVSFRRPSSLRAVKASWPHPNRAAVDEAGLARQAGERRVILFNLSGHGHFDMGAYDAYLAGALQDYAYPAEAIQNALSELPNVAVPA